MALRTLACTVLASHGHVCPPPQRNPHLPAGAPDALAVSTDPSLLRSLVDGSALRDLCARRPSLRGVSWRPMHVMAGSVPLPTAPCGCCLSLHLSVTLAVNVAALVSPVLLCSGVTPRSLLGATRPGPTLSFTVP